MPLKNLSISSDSTQDAIPVIDLSHEKPFEMSFEYDEKNEMFYKNRSIENARAFSPDEIKKAEEIATRIAQKVFAPESDGTVLGSPSDRAAAMLSLLHMQPAYLRHEIARNLDEYVHATVLDEASTNQNPGLLEAKAENVPHVDIDPNTLEGATLRIIQHPLQDGSREEQQREFRDLIATLPAEWRARIASEVVLARPDVFNGPSFIGQANSRPQITPSDTQIAHADSSVIYASVNVPVSADPPGDERFTTSEDARLDSALDPRGLDSREL